MQLDLTSIIVAIISLIGVIGGAWLGYTSRNKKQLVLDAQREQNQMDRFDHLLSEMNEIKKRLDQHNKYAEKFGDIDKTLVSIKKDIEYLRKDKDVKKK